MGTYGGGWGGDLLPPLQLPRRFCKTVVRAVVAALPARTHVRPVAREIGGTHVSFVPQGSRMALQPRGSCAGAIDAI